MTAPDPRRQPGSNEARKNLKILGQQIIAFLAHMDVAMKGPSNLQRGERIGFLCGELEMANDIALRFGLGLERNGFKLRKVRR